MRKSKRRLFLVRSITLLILAELFPKDLQELPIDPFDGNPVRYLSDGTGYKIYSIGVNRKDDGGTLTLNNARPYASGDRRSARKLLEEGDIVVEVKR